MDGKDIGIEKLMNKLGDFGRYQRIQFILQVISAIPTSIHMFSLVTVAAVPEHRCAISGVDSSIYTEPWNSTLVLNAIPQTDDGKLHSCKLYGENKTLEECQSWVYDTQYFTSSRGIEWDFVCNRRWMGAVTQTVFMSGVIIGSAVLGPLCDKLGRKTIFVWTGLLQTFAGVVVAFTTDFYSFVIIRFLYGIVGLSPFKAGYVLAAELVGPSKRAVCSTMFQVLFAVGVMLVSLWGFLIDNRFYLQIIYALHSLIIFPHWWLMDESPRWLWAKGRVRESLDIINKALKINKSAESVNTDLLLSYHKSTFTVIGLENGSANILDLFRTPNMLKKSVIIFGCFFANAVVYYGLGLNTGALNGNPYLMLFISAFMDLPGILIAMWLVDRIGNRALLTSTMFLSGSCLLVMIALPHGSTVATIAAMTGKLIISGAYSIVFKYGTELFPTVIRSTGVSVGTMWASVSAAITPLIILLESFNPKIPTAVFGLLAMLFGSLALLLPETTNRQLPQTLVDAENFGIGDTCFANCTSRKMNNSTSSLEVIEVLHKEKENNVIPKMF